mmetsp:Transcript_6886/g.16342  ORF Transcript_6886/g.16342 Transcript_6886/m.16342 type:complete len:245 (+) Transcript_6886:1693-2427(+)
MQAQPKAKRSQVRCHGQRRPRRCWPERGWQCSWRTTTGRHISCVSSWRKPNRLPWTCSATFPPPAQLALLDGTRRPARLLSFNAFHQNSSLDTFLASWTWSKRAGMRLMETQQSGDSSRAPLIDARPLAPALRGAFRTWNQAKQIATLLHAEAAAASAFAAWSPSPCRHALDHRRPSNPSFQSACQSVQRVRRVLEARKLSLQEGVCQAVSSHKTGWSLHARWARRRLALKRCPRQLQRPRCQS